MNRFQDIPLFQKSSEEVLQLLEGGQLYAYRDDGLFARLSCFANAVRVSRVLDLPAPIGLWETGNFAGNRDHGYANSFSEVFDWGEAISVEEVREGPGKRTVFSWPFLCLLDDEEPTKVLAELAGIVAQLQLRCPFCEPVNEALAQLGSAADRVGIHCRAGDVEGKIEWMFRKGYPASFWRCFFREEARRKENASYYIASNSGNLREAARRQLDDRARTLDDFLQPSDLQGSRLAYDYADQRLFAASGILVGCGFSSFVTFACMRAGKLPVSPLERVPEELSEAYVDLNQLWKARYLSDVSYLLGSQLEHSPIAAQLREEGYPVEEDPAGDGWSARVGGLGRRVQRGWLEVRRRLDGGRRLQDIRGRFFRFSRW